MFATIYMLQHRLYADGYRFGVQGRSAAEMRQAGEKKALPSEKLRKRNETQKCAHSQAKASSVSFLTWSGFVVSLICYHDVSVVVVRKRRLNPQSSDSEDDSSDSDEGSDSDSSTEDDTDDSSSDDEDEDEEEMDEGKEEPEPEQVRCQEIFKG